MTERRTSTIIATGTTTPASANTSAPIIDGDTNIQRILIHPNPKKGKPHCHVNDQNGNRLDIDGNVVENESIAAHLPLKT